ncbi:hypothetical protein GCM10009841_06720 [Microlunatus panaciterrae]|uniref:Uncharacterized protein n=1 Tax=Microlunatus panaciterrae TaxID=400768 RepID=A0ABS2RI51_9ACTN|nr:hypothetical protein [Microlunatus panaciterrae]MBM7798674.1 hypothetical protein [Microlunatus panaciterrae]
MDQLRRPFLIGSLVAIGLVLLICLGSNLFTGPPPFGERVSSAMNDPFVRAQLAERGIDPFDAQQQLSQTRAEDPPGLAIPDLALVNGLLLLILVLTALPLLIGDRATGTVQGIVSIVGGLLGLLGGIVLAIVAFVALMLMVSLFLAAPFGTLAYLAIFGSFDTGGSALILGVVIVLQVLGAILLVIAQQRFLLSKGLVLLFLTALLLTLLTSILHSIVPGILVSITDAIGALIISIVGAIWSLVILIGGIVGALRLLQLGRQGGGSALARQTPG